MNNPALAETAEFYRVDATLKLDPESRALLGQYMTPAPIVRFTASLFTETRGETPVIDSAANVGALRAALAERLCASAAEHRSLEFLCYEIDPALSKYLTDTLNEAQTQVRRGKGQSRHLGQLSRGNGVKDGSVVRGRTNPSHSIQRRADSRSE